MSWKALLGPEAHAEAGQVSVTEAEQHHEEDVPGVVGEQHGQVGSRLDVAHHEERKEQHPGRHQQGQQPTLSPWLVKQTQPMH